MVREQISEAGSLVLSYYVGPGDQTWHQGWQQAPTEPYS